MIYSLVAKRYQLVECQFTGTPAVGNKYPFLDIPNLSRNNIIVYGFEAFGATQLSVTPNTNTVIAAADIDQIVITLRDIHKDEFIYQIPYYTAIRSLNGGLPIIIKPRVINLTDCYMQITDTTGISQDEVGVVGLYYDLVS